MCFDGRAYSPQALEKTLSLIHIFPEETSSWESLLLLVCSHRGALTVGFGFAAAANPFSKLWPLPAASRPGRYFMGLNVSNEQIAHELALHGSDVQQMTAQLHEGIVKKSHR